MKGWLHDANIARAQAPGFAGGAWAHIEGGSLSHRCSQGDHFRHRAWHQAPHDVTLSKLAKGYGVPVEGLLEEPVPLAEAPEEAGPARKPLARLYDGARKGIETF